MDKKREFGHTENSSKEEKGSVLHPIAQMPQN
jgi:hypothetical protein